jgi:hypothetical protein
MPTTIKICIIILIILFAGLLGGVTNFFLIWEKNMESRESKMLFIKSILMGLCASLTVPLFLQILPNTLLEINDSMPAKNYLIIAGLCVLAAYFSKRFLEDLYDKVNKIEKKTDTIDLKVDEAKKAVEDVELQNQELDNIGDIVKDVVDKSNTPISPAEIEKVTDAVLNTTYSYRTIPGIAEDTVHDTDKVKEILDLLKNCGYVEMKKNRRGNDIWKGIYHLKTD